MIALIWNQLVDRPVRTILSVLMIAVALVLGLVMKGLSTGVLSEKISRTQGIGADLMVQPPHSSYLIGMGENVLPASVAAKLMAVKGVEAASPVATEVGFTNRFEAAFGIDLASFNRVSGGFHYLRGGPFTGPYTAIVDDIYIRTHHVGLGSHLHILDHTFIVTGIVEHGKGARVYIPLNTLQSLVAPGKCAIVFIKCTSPDLTPVVEQRLRQLDRGALRDYQITRLSDLTSLIATSSIVGLRQFLLVVIVFAAVINFLVVFLGLYVQVLGQTRHIGILRALGATRSYLIGMYLGQALLLAIAGTVLACVFYELTKLIVTSLFPGLSFLLTPGSLLAMVAIAFASALLGAAYPAQRAVGYEPMTALNYE